MMNISISVNKSNWFQNTSKREASDDMNLKHAVYNPYNLYGLRHASSELKEMHCTKSPDEFQKKLMGKMDRLSPSFKSSVRASNREQQEVKLAHDMHDAPILKQFAFNFGICIKELFEIAYLEDAQDKIGEAFRFYRKNQLGAVSLEDNFFLNSLKMPEDATLRVLFSSLAQIIAVGENKAWLRMCKKIEDETKSNPAAKQKYADFIDIDLFSALGETCGRDAEGLPDIEAKWATLYIENKDTEVRKYMPLQHPQKFSIKDLNLTPSELSYIQKEQGLAINMSPNEKVILIQRGIDLFVINPDTEFLANAKKRGEPLAAGSSGSAARLIIALYLLAPSIKRKFGLQNNHGVDNNSEKFAKQTLIFDENYYWERYFEALMVYIKFNGHHSMNETQQGIKYGYQIIVDCNRPNSEFCFDEISKNIFEKMMNKSKLVAMHNRSIFIA